MNLDRARPVSTSVEPARELSLHGDRVADCLTPIRSRAEQARAAVDTEAA
ncbi:MAG: hypothetical protein QOD63_614 [Actinomycetota bacterium]|jgi:hypothetical protein|nr:hypothetical protein [Actinomycetota bacterium]